VKAFIVLATLLLVTVSDSFAGTFDFNIESVARTERGWRVVTRGACFEIEEGIVKCDQRIAAQRHVAVVRVGELKGALTQTKSSDPYKCRLVSSNGKLCLTITGDSVLQVSGARELVLTGVRGFDPEFRQSVEASAVFADDRGGVGAYAAKGERIHVTGLLGGRWQVKYPLLVGRDVLISVFPPRQFDWNRAREDVLVHFFPKFLPYEQRKSSGFTIMSERPLPTDSELAEWRTVGNILVLHLEVWHGFGVSNIKPLDPDRFAAVMRRAHELGYKVLLYTSPYYYLNPNIDDFEAEMRHILSYGADGLYWDGTYLGVEKAWDIARRARRLLGDKLLYVHCTSTPFSQPRMFCPFVDTYADWILRGEVFGKDFMDPLYFRYLVSGYNLSNAIGTLCYETRRIDRESIQLALESNARIPYWPGSQTADNNTDYFLHPEERELYMNVYCPAVSKLVNEKSYARLEAVSRKRRAEFLPKWRKEQKKRLLALRGYLSRRKCKMAALAKANMAAFRPVTASDVAWTESGLHGLGPVPQYAIDGDPNTHWAADFAPQWLEVDLGKTRTIGRVVVLHFFQDKRFYHYDIQLSNDQLNWRTVVSKTTDSPVTPTGDTYVFAPTKARYVRVLMKHNSANVGLHISELQVFAPGGAAR